jgi:hypothetical protein
MVAIKELFPGQLKLSDSTWIELTISSWKGRHNLSIRKFVDTIKYNGPTKSGLIISRNILSELLKTLVQIRSEIIPNSDRQFHKISKNGEQDIIVSIIHVDDANGLPSIDIREYINIPTYTGPTRKGIRFAFDKLGDFISLLEVANEHLLKLEGENPTLFANESHPNEEKDFSDIILKSVLQNGPKKFPWEFLDNTIKCKEIELPQEPIILSKLPDNKYQVQSDFSFCMAVRNIVEGNYICYSHLQGFRKILIPVAMIDIFKVVKNFENYLRDIRHSLIQAYSHKSGHIPLAILKTKEAFSNFGFPWFDQ